MEDVSYGVVIVTYNRLSLLKECLQCVIEQKKKFKKILVVDNSSTDGTEDYLDGLVLTEPQIEVYHSDKNLGGAGGFMVGVEKLFSQVDYLLLIDDDAMLCRDFLFNIDKGRVEGVFAYSGTVETNNIVDTTHRRILTNRIFLRKKDIPLIDYNNSYFDYDLSTFCGLCFNTSLVKKIGFPCGDYFIWYDDTEYSLRLLKYTKIRNVNSARINHKTTLLASSDRLNWKSFYGYRNMLFTGKKYSTFPLAYCLIRYSYHVVRIIQYIFMSFLKYRNNDISHYYRISSKLHATVIVESIKGRLGIHDYFKPGLKF